MANVPQPTALKILAIGSPLSELTTLQQKVTAINGKHGPFDACVIAGDLFKEGSDGSELSGIELPVPTYFTIGKHALPSSVAEGLTSNPEAAPNLVFLGKTGVFTTAQGLKIAVVGGVPSEDGADDSPFSPTTSKASIASLLSHPAIAGSDSLLETAKAALPTAFKGVDVLLSTSPPPSINLLSPSFTSSGITLAQPSAALTEVIKAARPRYMFWADGEGFWEREPFGWTGPDGKDERWTRAVKLGALGALCNPGPGKPARWFYATNLPAQTSETKPPSRPGNATPNPLTITKKRAAEDAEGSDAKRGKTEAPPEDYVCKICQTPGHWIQDCPQKEERDPSKPPEGYTCNICQSPDHFIRECPQRESRGPRKPPAGYTCKVCGEKETHYVRECPAVKERESKRAERREMSAAECWFCLSNPKVTKHLIVAIGSETYVTLPKGQLIPRDTALVPGGGHVLIIPVAHHPTILSIPAEDVMKIATELEAYKASLKTCYASYGAVPVSFEVGRHAGKGGHAHVQIIPVPKELGDQVADAFTKAGEAAGVVWEAEPERALAKAGAHGNYFKLECPDGKVMVHLLRGGFDLQFGRVVLAGLMGLHNRISWKDCVGTDAEEKEDAVKFKKALQPFLPKTI